MRYALTSGSPHIEKLQRQGRAGQSGNLSVIVSRRDFHHVEADYIEIGNTLQEAHGA